MPCKHINPIKTSQPPKQCILYKDPLTEPIADKKIKLSIDKDAFIFMLSNTEPNLLFIHYNNSIRINLCLKEYTQTTYIKQQFIICLEQPLIIENRLFTCFLKEKIDIFFFLYS